VTTTSNPPPPDEPATWSQSVLHPGAEAPTEAGARRALGRDPFEAFDAFDPFAEGLARLGTTRRPKPEPVKQVDGPDWLDRWLNPDDRQRLSLLEELTEEGVGYDRFGFSPEVARRSFPLFMALYRFYFRVRSRGHEHLPRSGPAILAANRGGLLPFDAAMLEIDTFLHTDPARLLRKLVSRDAGALPWLGVYAARMGHVVDTGDNISDLLEEGQLLLSFPEGVEGAVKPISQHFCLQHFDTACVEAALRAHVPIIPVAVVGSDNQAPVLFDFKTLARRLDLPTLPITPTFPWLGAFGLLPYPVQYTLVYGDALNLHKEFGPEEAEDPRLLRQLSRRVRRVVQKLLDDNR
jgi:1-acyl-sn-glycerol-3-phosphate acyltransferase